MIDVVKLFDVLKKQNSFVYASFIYILANGIGQGITFLSNIFFTRYMTQNDYGLYSTYYSYVSILIPFIGMNLYVGLTNAYVDYKKEINKLRSSLLLLSLIGLFVTSIFISLYKLIFSFSLSWDCIFFLLLHGYGFFLINFYIQAMNMENNIINKGSMIITSNVLQAVLAITAVLIYNTYSSRVVGSATGIVLCGLFAFFYFLKRTKPVIHIEYWKYAISISLPAIIGSVAAMIMQQCDKVMITSFIDAKSTAVYALVFNIGYILYAIQQATGGVWQVWLYNSLKQNQYSNIPMVQKWYMHAMFIFTTGLYMVSPELIKIISPKNYWHFEYITPFIVGSFFILVYTMNTSVVQYMKKTGINSMIVSVGAIINIVLNYMFIPKFGALSAAYTSVISYLFIFFLSFLYLKYKRTYFFRSQYYFTYITLTILLGLLFKVTVDKVFLRYLIYTVILSLETIYLIKHMTHNHTQIT